MKENTPITTHRKHYFRILSILLIFSVTAGLLPCCPINARKSVSIDMTDSNIENIDYKETPSKIPYGRIQDKISQFIKERENDLASVSVSVFWGQEVLYNGYYGYSDIDGQIPADENTVYEWGSISKLLTWVSIMQLYEKKLIDFDTDIREYLPEGFLKKLKYDEPITLLNLMNHNAGWQEVPLGIETENESDIIPLGDALKKTEPLQVHRPGEVTAYSNWGAALAGYIVENVSGMDYAEYVHENILKPLNMEHTSIKGDYSDNPWVKEQRAKTYSYSITPESRTDLGNFRSYIMIYPAGAAAGTINDLTAFAKSFTASSDEECKLFESVETLNLMKESTSCYGDSELPKVCHGMWVLRHNVDALGHNGATNGFTTNFIFDPDSKLGIVIMTNEAGESTFCTGLAKLLFGSLKDNQRIKNSQEGLKVSYLDLHGSIVPYRTCETGPLSLLSALSFVPIGKSQDGITYPITEDISLKRLNEQEFILEDRKGNYNYFYITSDAYGNFKIESEGTDYHYQSAAAAYIRLASALYPLLLMAILILAGLIMLIIRLIRKIKKKEKEKDKDRICSRIYLAQYISGIVFGFFFLLEYIFGIILISKTLTIILCIITLLFALSFAVLGIINIARSSRLIKNHAYEIRGSVRYYLISAAELIAVFIMCFWQMFFFWRA